MLKKIAIPTSPWFTRSNFSLTRAVGDTISPFSGKHRSQEYDSVYWHGTASLPPMNRTQTVEWQSFLLELTGTRNYFLFTDPDAKAPRGGYDGNTLDSDVRVNSGSQVTSVTLSFSASTITAGTAIFDGLIVGDFFTVSGGLNEENNGTHKITTRTSDTVVVVDSILVTESSTASCKVRQNIKGSTALSLEASSNTATGTILKGDYLAVYDGQTTSTNPVQLVMATENATKTTQSGSPDHYSVAIQPKLRADFSDGDILGFSTLYNRSRFRLMQNVIEWDANHLSMYGISFDFIEVI